MTDESMLPGDWPEPVITADILIERNLKEALEQEAYFLESISGLHKDESDESRRLRLTTANMHWFAFMLDAVMTDFLIEVQAYNRSWADAMAASIDSKLEWGEYYPEMLWQWATERGLDPDQITEEAKAKFAKKDSK